MKTLAVIQARMGSSRLPGKTLADIAGEPLLQRIVSRVSLCRLVDEIVVATTTDQSDDRLAMYCEEIATKCYRGSVANVLDRFYQAAREFNASLIVRITADDPFKDPAVTDHVINELMVNRSDYASNTLEPTYPEGLDVEVFTFDALERAWHEASLPSEREHVTPYIWKNPGTFKTVSVKHSRDLSRLRWTIDYPDDLAFARMVYDRLADKKSFLMQDILDLLDREPALGLLNAGIVRNEGYLKSIAQETGRAATGVR